MIELGVFRGFTGYSWVGYIGGGVKKKGKSEFLSGDRDISQCHWLFLPLKLVKRRKTHESGGRSPVRLQVRLSALPCANCENVGLLLNNFLQLQLPFL